MASNDEVGTFLLGQPAPQSVKERMERRGGEGRGGEGRGGEGNTKVCIYCTHHELICDCSFTNQQIFLLECYHSF